MPIIKRIEHATRELGKPQDWNEKNDPPCGVLPIRDIVTQDGPFMVSAWEFTPLEIAALQRGETLKLCIRGTGHPVVALIVGSID